MLNGALCLSDSSRYLEEELKNGRDLVCYSLTELDKLPDIIESLLRNYDSMKKIIDSGYRKAAEGHTWLHRAAIIGEMLDEEGM